VANGQSHEQRPSVLWWCYLALYAALFCLTFVNFVSEGLFESFGAAFLSWAILSSDAVCIMVKSGLCWINRVGDAVTFALATGAVRLA
jgi:hypothetical protein